MQKLSYGIGLNISKNFIAQKLELDMAAFNRGMSDGLNNKEPAIAQDEIMKAMQEFQNGKRTKNAKMVRAAKRLNETDVANLAAYYASLKK